MSDRIASVAGALLVGGTSSRMGADKAHRAFAGAPAAVRASRLLAALFGEVMLIGGAPPAEAVGRRVPDVEGPPSALRGIVSALAAARAPRVLVVATDLPLLTPELLLALVAWPEADVVLPHGPGGIEPLCALWSRAGALEPARHRLASGQLAVRELVTALRSIHLGAEDLRAVDPEDRALANANTPAEWARLERLC